MVLYFRLRGSFAAEHAQAVEQAVMGLSGVESAKVDAARCLLRVTPAASHPVNIRAVERVVSAVNGITPVRLGVTKKRPPRLVVSAVVTIAGGLLTAAAWFVGWSDPQRAAGLLPFSLLLGGYAVLAIPLAVGGTVGLLRERLLPPELFAVVVAGLALWRWRTSEAVIALLMFRAARDAFIILNPFMPIQDFVLDRDHFSVKLLLDGEPVSAPPSSILPGDVLLLPRGERLCVDADIISGGAASRMPPPFASLGRDALSTGTRVYAGAVLQNDAMLRAVQTEGEPLIVALHARFCGSNEQGPASRAIRLISQFFAPIAAAAALMMAVLGGGFSGLPQDDCFSRALIMGAFACAYPAGALPGAAALTALDRALRRGALFTRGSAVEKLALCRTCAFNKQDVLSTGVFVVSSVLSSAEYSSEDVLACAAIAQFCWDDPMAECLRRTWGGKIDPSEVTAFEAVPGEGVTCVYNSHALAAGDSRLMERAGISVDLANGIAVYVAVDGVYAGTVVIADPIRRETPSVLSKLKQTGVKRTVMLTSDNQRTAAIAATHASVDSYEADLTTVDKIACLKDMTGAESVAYVGAEPPNAEEYRVTDAAVAFCASFEDAVRADPGASVFDGDLRVLPGLMSDARRALTISRAGSAAIFAVNFAGIILAMCGMLTLPIAVAVCAAASAAAMLCTVVPALAPASDVERGAGIPG